MGGVSEAQEVRRDVADRDDIEGLVRDFYTRAFADPLLGPVFTDVAQMDLEAHLPVMCDFWETVLLGTGTYRRNAMAPHVALHTQAPMGPGHFRRWLELWNATVDDRHTGERAQRAKDRAAGIAASMRRRVVEGGGAGSLLA